jgi:uncharacterized protein (DUF433 family)
VARFVPDEIRDEPINVGVILHAISSGEVKHHFLESYDQLEKVLPKTQVNALRVVLSALGYELKTHTEDANYLMAISQNYRHQLQFSNIRGVLTSDPETELSSLYSRMVSWEGRNASPAGVPPITKYFQT